MQLFSEGINGRLAIVSDGIVTSFTDKILQSGTQQVLVPSQGYGDSSTTFSPSREFKFISSMNIS